MKKVFVLCCSLFFTHLLVAMELSYEARSSSLTNAFINRTCYKEPLKFEVRQDGLLWYVTNNGEDKIDTEELKNDAFNTALDYDYVEAIQTIGAYLKYNNEKIAFACASKRACSALKAFINKGVDVNSKDGEGNSLLHKVCKSGERRTVWLLLESKADVNAKNNDGSIPSALIPPNVNLEINDMIKIHSRKQEIARMRELKDSKKS